MPVRRLWLSDFRNYKSLDISFSEGLTVIIGNNGQGKTNLLEGVSWLSRGVSFRNAPTEALIKSGKEKAIIRAEVHEGTRKVLLEAELVINGKNRILVNSNKVKRLRDLLGYFQTTLFSPDDLQLVKGGPAERRKYLDDLLIDIHPKNYEVITDLEKVLRQRNTLLKQAKGVLSSEISNTLSVWDTKLVQLGEMLAFSRQELIQNLDKSFPEIMSALQGKTSETKLQYSSLWQEEGLEKALEKSRENDLRRGVTTIGPHRDDLFLNLNNMPARTHASQGEQRSLALSLRLAGHKVISEKINSDPVILLDDVFSELDEQRSKKLIEILPDCQTLISSAGELPHGIQPPSVIKILNGEVLVHE